MNHRWKSVLTFVGGWLLGAVFVRLALDWSDSQPYEGAVTEARYIVIAVLALGIGVGATIAAVVIWRKDTDGAPAQRDTRTSPACSDRLPTQRGPSPQLSGR